VPDDRWLVVGLGNPGPKYAQTRHNVGADSVRALVAREHGALSVNKRIRCEVAELTVAGTRISVTLPTSFMNRSGDPTQAAAAWFKTPAQRLIVCHDDLDVEVGSLKVKLGGGHAGHNGLRDIDRALGTRDYLRVRIGIGRPPGRMPAKDFVLHRFHPAEAETIAVTLQEAADAVLALAVDGLEPTQNRFHVKRDG